MVIRITWASFGPVRGRVRALPIGERPHQGQDLKGLRGRWAGPGRGRQGPGFAVSLWDNLANMQAYEQGALYREVMAPLQPFFVGEYKTYRLRREVHRRRRVGAAAGRGRWRPDRSGSGPGGTGARRRHV